MRTRKNFILLLLVIVGLLSGCANTSAQVQEDEFISNMEYDNYDAWEQENQLRMFLNFEKTEMDEGDDGFYGLGDIELSESRKNIVTELREEMVAYFKDVHKIDISDKLEKQSVVLFKAKGNKVGVMGYVDVNSPNVLNLNEQLLNEYAECFETTYVHESLHQIGFRSTKTLMIEEGFTDALTDLAMTYMGKVPVLTENYFETRTLAYQMLEADSEIVSLYLSGEPVDIIERINKKLENVPRVFKNVENVGERLESLEDGLYTTGLGMANTIEPYYIALEAQEIVKAYCQACNPSNETIDYIREHYLVADYEKVAIEEDDNGFFVNIKDEMETEIIAGIV